MAAEAEAAILFWVGSSEMAAGSIGVGPPLARADVIDPRDTRPRASGIDLSRSASHITVSKYHNQFVQAVLTYLSG